MDPTCTCTTSPDDHLWEAKCLLAEAIIFCKRAQFGTDRHAGWSRFLIIFTRTLVHKRIMPPYVHICDFRRLSINSDSEQPKSREEQNSTVRLLEWYCAFYRIYIVVELSKLRYFLDVLFQYNFYNYWDKFERSQKFNNIVNYCSSNVSLRKIEYFRWKIILQLKICFIVTR